MSVGVQRLRELAEAAKDDPWPSESGEVQFRRSLFERAAANPETVLALLDVVEAVEAYTTLSVAAVPDYSPKAVEAAWQALRAALARLEET